MDVVLSLFPIVLLIFLMVKKNAWPSHAALPVTAGVLYLLKIFYFKSGLTPVHAAVIDGLLTAWTPILIIWGAILFFMFMEHSGCMGVLRTWLNSITANRVGQIMIIGWAFSFLIEGASGFGTPAALAAPLLVGMGFRPVPVAILCLVMNSVPVSFGVAGTPTWFGLGQLGLTEAELLETGAKTAWVHAVAALIIPLFALKAMVSFREIRENIVFIYISVLSCVLPYLALSRFNYEFPSIAGGLIGLLISITAARRNIGLVPVKRPEGSVSPKSLLKAGFPIYGTALILLLTRIKQLGLKPFLSSDAHALSVPLGPLGIFTVSPSLVVGLKGILGTGDAWTHKLLYVPSIVPFVVIVLLSALFLKTGGAPLVSALKSANARMAKPIVALLGALVLVKLLMSGGDSACTMIIGRKMAGVFGGNWRFFAAYLGALGSFFAGSNTVSNLTFAGIQDAIAHSLNLNRTTILALQHAGGAMGNMVCINNIVAVCSILGLSNVEGAIIKKTFPPLLVYGVIAGLVGMLL